MRFAGSIREKLIHIWFVSRIWLKQQVFPVIWYSFFLFSFVYRNSLGFFFILLVTVYASFPSISSFDMSELTQTQNLYFNDLVALFTYAYFSKPSPITGISLPVLAYPYSVHTCLCPWKLKNKSTTAPSTYSLVDLSSLSNYLLDLNLMDIPLDLNLMDIPVLHRCAKMNSFL